VVEHPAGQFVKMGHRFFQRPGLDPLDLK
jgi:hypothetical protein